MILHANADGCFQRLEIDEDFQKKYVMETDLWVKQGDKVSIFKGANDAIGTLILKFNCAQELQNVISNPDNYLRVVTK